jgi:hypothetical protein
LWLPVAVMFGFISYRDTRIHGFMRYLGVLGTVWSLRLPNIRHQGSMNMARYKDCWVKSIKFRSQKTILDLEAKSLDTKKMALEDCI